MDHASDKSRLDLWRERRDRHAMDALIRRNIHFVYGTAVRMLGEVNWAQDVTQTVFLLLIQKSPRVPNDAALMVWLHRATRYAAANARRMQDRREAMQRRAAQIGKPNMSNDIEAIDQADEHARLLPLLDEAIESLRPVDRSGILLCYFQQRSFREIAAALGTTESTARKRVERAVHRVRAFFASRGLEAASASLLACFAREASYAAPAQLTETTTKLATLSQLAASWPSNEILTGVLRTMLLTKVKIAAAISLTILLTSVTAVIAIERALRPTDASDTQAVANDDKFKNFPIDPVEYITNGKESAGKDELSIERAPYRYKFLTAENQATFQKDPERYEVQLGGACARMGPLSSTGILDHYALHEGKIYVFASEECRTTFLANTAQLLESDDPVPDVTDESAKRGRTLLELAIKAMGGAERIDALTSYEDKMLRMAGNDESYDAMTILFFKDRAPAVCEMHKRNEPWWSHTSNGPDAWAASNEEGIEPMSGAQHHAFDRVNSRRPLVIARSRGLKNFVCSWTGSTELNGVAVDEVAVALNGSTTTLLIDGRNGELLAIRYLGRGPREFIGDVLIKYSDFKTIDGITLPLTRTADFNGEYAPGLSGTLDEVHFNRPIEPTLFEMPKSK